MTVSSNSTLSFDAGESIAISAKAGGTAIAGFNREGIQADARGLFIEGGNNHVQLTAQQNISVIAQTSGEGNLQGIAMQSDNSSLDFSALNGDITISATGDSANNAEALMLGGNNSEASFTGNNIFIDALAGSGEYSFASGLDVHSGMQSTFTVKDTFKLTTHADDAWGIVVSSGSSNTILGGDSGVTVIISCAKYGVKDDAGTPLHQVAIDVADGGKHLIQTGSGNDHIVIQGDMTGEGENTIDAGAGNDIVFLHGSIEGSNVTINGGEGQDVLILKAESWEHFTQQYENLFSNGTITGIESIQYIVGEKGGEVPEWLEQFCSGGITLSEYKDGTLDGFSLNLFGISPASDELDSLLSLSRAINTDEPESGLFASIQHNNAPYEAIPAGGYGTPVDSLMSFGQEEEALLQQMFILKSFAS